MIKIKNRIINFNSEPFIIPEIGINHNGKLETAFKIVDSAKRAGAEVIKHQTHEIDDEMSEEAKKIKPGNSRKNIFSIIKESSLSEEKEYKLFKYVESKKMIYLSTPFSRKAVDRLIKFATVSGTSVSYKLIFILPLFVLISICIILPFNFWQLIFHPNGIHHIQNL